MALNKKMQQAHVHKNQEIDKILNVTLLIPDYET